MKGLGPRILLMGGNYRALCALERLLDRGERVVAFIGEEGSGERDFCPEILEACDRATIPARSGRKLGEEIVRWLEDRIRPDLAISVGLHTEVPLAIGGNCRLGLIEVVDSLTPDQPPTVSLRQCGTTLLKRSLPSPVAEDDRAADLFLQLAETTLLLLDEYLDQIGDRHGRPQLSVPYEVTASIFDEVEPGTPGALPGEETSRLEASVREYVACEQMMALPSPIEGAELLFDRLGLRSGDEVAFPGIVSHAFLTAARLRGLRPLFIDIDTRTLTLDPQRLEEALAEQTRAVLVSHTFGQPADLARLRQVTQRHAIPLIEDASCALGAQFRGERVGYRSDACLFTLPLSTQVGGAHAALVSISGAWGDLRAGPMSTRLANDAAAHALVAFERLEDELSARRHNASIYSGELVRYDAFQVPFTPDGRLPTYAAYALRITSFARTCAEDLTRLLAECGIETRMIAGVGNERELSDAPLAERVRASTILLPVSSNLTHEMQKLVLDAIFDYAIG